MDNAPGIVLIFMAVVGIAMWLEDRPFTAARARKSIRKWHEKQDQLKRSQVNSSTLVELDVIFSVIRYSARRGVYPDRYIIGPDVDEQWIMDQLHKHGYYVDRTTSENLPTTFTITW